MQTSSNLAPGVAPKVDRRAVIAHLLSCTVAARSSEASASPGVTPGAATGMTPSSPASSGGKVLPRQWTRPQGQGGAVAACPQEVRKPSGPMGEQKQRHPSADAAMVAPLPLLQGGFALPLSLATYRFPAVVAGEALPEAVQRKPDPIQRVGGGMAATAMPFSKPHRNECCGEDGDGASEDGGESGEEGCRALGPCPPYHPSAYAESIQCTHVEHWKRLRAKRGYAYFVCHQCAAKWRLLLPYSKPKRSPPSPPLQPAAFTPAGAGAGSYAYPSQAHMAVPTPLSLSGAL